MHDDLSGRPQMAQAGAAGNLIDIDHNPDLRPWVQPTPNNVAGKGRIEVPGQSLNLVWQNRAAPPTPYENALGDALEQVFEAGASSPEEIVAGFERLGVRTQDGTPWTTERFLAEMTRLGA